MGYRVDMKFVLLIGVLIGKEYNCKERLRRVEIHYLHHAFVVARHFTNFIYNNLGKMVLFLLLLLEGILGFLVPVR